jgi:hypothetical protein
MKVILGPLPCATCHRPVTIVRRDVEQPCNGDCAVCAGAMDEPWCKPTHTHTLPDVGPFTTVDDDGTRHECVG